MTALENEVFSHLYNFFRRYYDEGDFISLRRYKEGVYAIPYEGEEVKLHWANARPVLRQDQPRTSATTPSRLPIGQAGALQAGRGRHRAGQHQGAGRQGTPVHPGGRQPRSSSRRTANSSSASSTGPIAEQATSRTELNATGGRRPILAAGAGRTGRRAGRKADAHRGATRRRTLLDKHLADYTARNTFDYFIHKDLGGFLRRELDFYIKNEVMHLDDIENEDRPRVEQYLSKIKVIRRIAHKIIDFLAQIEDFQKKLWLKKKFVVETNYCITLDRCPRSFTPRSPPTTPSGGMGGSVRD